MPQLGCLPVFLFLLLVALLPLAFAQIFVTALVKLRLDPDIALMVIIGIFVGSFINIPITRITRQEDVVFHPLTMFGLRDFLPNLQRVRKETLIALNVGGCLIPTSLAVYEIHQLLLLNFKYIILVTLAVMINVGVCYWFATPIPKIGIGMPAFIPPFVAVLSALFLAPAEAPAVAFVSGVLGPLIGADLLHFREIPRIATGMASIGGAGTFDGIVLSGIVAAYLA